MLQALQDAKALEEERSRLLEDVTALVTTELSRLRAATGETVRLEGKLADELRGEGLGASSLPPQFSADDYYVEKPVEHLLMLRFDAASMPAGDAEVEQMLEQQLRVLISVLGKRVVLAYTGIAWNARQRWQTYRQCRTLFRRMQLWWCVAGSDEVQVGAAITRLEASSIKAKDTVLSKTDDKVFGNRVKHGGSGKAPGVLHYQGYILTLCQGEIHL
jgi:hypothetical protein